MCVEMNKSTLSGKRKNWAAIAASLAGKNKAVLWHPAKNNIAARKKGMFLRSRHTKPIGKNSCHVLESKQGSR